MLSGQSQMQGAQLEKAIEKAGKYPLGSFKNPVRASAPEGQRAYLQRLRCATGDAPQFERIGNFGPGIYDNIIDGYKVICPGDDTKYEVIMDMYHDGYVENRPVDGFTIVPQ